MCATRVGPNRDVLASAQTHIRTHANSEIASSNVNDLLPMKARQCPNKVDTGWTDRNAMLFRLFK